MPDPEPYEPAGLTGNAPADLQAETARLSGEWKLGKLNEISDEQAREDLGRLSGQMMSIVARSARLADGKTDAVPDEVVARGTTAAEKFLLRWRGEADPRHVKAIDTYWICTAEHGLNASTFTARITASTGADCGAALSSAVGALSGPLHGGAPAYVKPMLEEVAAMGDAERWVRDALERKKRIMGFGHRIYRAEDPRSRLLKRMANELGSEHIEVAEELERVALVALQERSPDRVLATNVEYYSAVVLDVAEIPPPLAPAMFACSRVAGWSAHILEQKRTGRLFRPAARYVGPAERSLVDRLSDPRRGRRPAEELGRTPGNEQELATLRHEWDDELEAAARNPDYRVRGVAYRAIAQFRFRQKLELLRRGLEDESPGARGSALIALKSLSRDHPGDVNAFRPAAARARGPRPERRRAAARDRLPAERAPPTGARSSCSTGSPTTTRTTARCATRPARWRPRS